MTTICSEYVIANLKFHSKTYVFLSFNECNEYKNGRNTAFSSFPKTLVFTVSLCSNFLFFISFALTLSPSPTQFFLA